MLFWVWVGARLRACLALCRAHHNAGSSGRPAQLLPAESPLTHPPPDTARRWQGWTALSYARAKGKYGPTEEAGVYPEDVLLYYGASKVGAGGPPVLGARSPRQSFDPAADGFLRERGSYQKPVAHP